ncbi:hypothetical protein HKBW3S43_01725, partial [Candidatus Hakubella thermalkaliphila]
MSKPNLLDSARESLEDIEKRVFSQKGSNFSICSHSANLN